MKKFILSVLSPLITLIYLIISFGATFPLPASAFPTPRIITSRAITAYGETVSSSARTSTPSAITSSYACILGEEVYFYSEESDVRGLFLLPSTYYVRVLSVNGEFSKVEYLTDSPTTRKLTGYCKTSDLTFVDYIPVRPYLYATFEVTYYIEEPTSDISSGNLSGIKATCAYYGDYRIGTKTYCYVLRGEEFGYIPKPSDFRYERNREYDEYLASLSSSSPSERGNSLPPLQIAILVLLCILVPVIAALILRPPKKPPYETDE